MRHYPLIIVGGGITGTGILRDASMRGIKALLIERKDLGQGTSSRFHGLLHSGARYAVGDPNAAKECIEENTILRKIAPHSVELTEGFFVRTPEDEEEYEGKWVEACAKAGIETKPITVREALELEPNLSKDILSCHRVPDSAVDGFRIVWQTAESAASYGGEFSTYTALQEIKTKNGQVLSVVVKNTRTGVAEEIGCDMLVNAAGSWGAEIAQMAGIKVNVFPDRGLLLAFNHRFTDRVINRLHKSSNADIVVPHGSVTILGTTSVRVDDPGDTTVLTSEAVYMLDIGKKVFPDIYNYRILRGFAGTRPLYSPTGSSDGRDISRNFVVLDHENEGLKGFASIIGGKFTTYRLMAERMTNLVSAKFNNNVPCRTAQEPLVRETTLENRAKALKYFPKMGVELCLSRQGKRFEEVLKKIEEDPSKAALVCECELVTRAEVEVIAALKTSHSLSDVRHRTRMGMGTCQGNFCAFRGLSAVSEEGFLADTAPEILLRQFVEERWGGIRPLLWGTQLKEVELARGIYSTLLNADGESIN